MENASSRRIAAGARCLADDRTVGCAWPAEDKRTQGCIRFSGDRLHLTWTETGGPEIAPPTRRGFGTQVMETLIRLDLGGQLRFDWRPEGLICEIERRI